jgi:hypothetical protein
MSNGATYEICPSYVMPYLCGYTQEVSSALLLRHWAVPYHVLAFIFGRDAMYWERLEESLGRISLVGSLVKKGSPPTDLAADEKITHWNGQEAYIALTSGKDCVLGAELSMSEDSQGLLGAYGVFKSEAQDCTPGYSPQSVNLDGWKATNHAWKALFPDITVILCFLHAFLKIRDMGKSLKEAFYEIGGKVWEAYRKQTKEAFEAELAILSQWATDNMSVNEKVMVKIKELCAKVSRFSAAYDCPSCYRTSNQIDRPMNLLDRYLYQIRYFHGHRKTANLKIRAWAMVYNFAPFCQRVQARKQNPKKASRFEQLNGFLYHKDWLDNLLIASSLNGFKTPHKKS